MHAAATPHPSSSHPMSFRTHPQASTSPGIRYPRQPTNPHHAQPVTRSSAHSFAVTLPSTPTPPTLPPAVSNGASPDLAGAQPSAVTHPRLPPLPRLPLPTIPPSSQHCTCRPSHSVCPHHDNACCLPDLHCPAVAAQPSAVTLQINPLPTRDPAVCPHHDDARRLAASPRHRCLPLQQVPEHLGGAVGAPQRQRQLLQRQVQQRLVDQAQQSQSPTSMRCISMYNLSAHSATQGCCRCLGRQVTQSFRFTNSSLRPSPLCRPPRNHTKAAFYVNS